VLASFAVILIVELFVAVAANIFFVLKVIVVYSVDTAIVEYIDFVFCHKVHEFYTYNLMDHNVINNVDV
jgi:hypothetical protein